MHKSNRLAYFNISQFILDITFLLLSFAVSHFITSFFTILKPAYEYVWIFLIYMPLWLSIAGALKLYDVTSFNYYDRIIRNLLSTTILSGSLLIVALYSLKEFQYSRLLFIIYMISCCIFLVIERFLFLRYIKHHSKDIRKQVLVIGSQELYEKFEYFLSKTSIDINIKGFINTTGLEVFAEHVLLKDIEAVKTLLKNYVIDEVIFILPQVYTKDVEKYVWVCEEMGITVRLILDLFDLPRSKTHVGSLGPLPMITFHTVSLNNFQLAIKRIVDIIGAVTGIILFGWIILIASIAIRIESPGPIFFKQNRVGRNGRLFKIIKLRSMYIDAEERKKELEAKNEMKDGFMFKMKDDPRITKVGKFIRKTSIDELPQFFNVLKGEMSLVGTRPPTTEEVKKYETHHLRRISINPGITGLWQVTGRSNITDFEDVVNLDTEYIDRWSIFLDISILFKTFTVIFAKKGAY